MWWPTKGRPLNSFAIPQTGQAGPLEGNDVLERGLGGTTGTTCTPVFAAGLWLEWYSALESAVTARNGAERLAACALASAIFGASFETAFPLQA